MTHDHTIISINEITDESGKTVKKTVMTGAWIYKSESGYLYRLGSGETVKDLIQLDKALAPLRQQ